MAGVVTTPRRCASVCAAALVALVAAGCVRPAFLGAREPSMVKFLSAVQDGQLIDVKEGTRIVVRLADERDDYDWALKSTPDARILKHVSLPAAGPGSAPRSGALIDFAFDAVGPGITELELAYLPVKNASKPLDTFVITVRVEAL